MLPVRTINKNIASSIFHLRERRGTPRRSTANALPPARPTVLLNRFSSFAVVGAVVVTVSVAVTGSVPLIAETVPIEQAGVLLAPAGLLVIAHVNWTLPVNPPLGVTVRVEVPL